ncbi:hypothetical protein EWM64_g3163 [Hericium alpestre]|uniref:Skg3/CAF120-like PH-like domain-containing protein n=1 Tax=Hericium alpestre TaxID=135208 RepID=A0A4Z0A2A8_9AGAM|nr:hypothetical protein EWM64_g3163 [Hericium alpestre]
MASSSTPQWDSRNRGFIPPSELQQLRQASPVKRDFHSPDAQPPDSPPPHAMPSHPPSHPSPAHSPARPAQANGGHSRSSSFFSFLKSQSHSEAPPQPQQPAFSTLQPQRASTQLPIDEHGRMPPTDMTRGAMGAASSTLPPQHERRASTGFGRLQLTIAHAHKIYFSGPLVRRIERLPDGHRPSKDEGWRDVWAQLGGTTLSVWDMQEIEEASKHGKEVPPTYINITDAFVQVLGSVTIPPTPTSPQQKYTNVVTVNSAGSNLLLFACPDTPALISWATAFRLAAWEKSRLEEIYTAHLLRITYEGNAIPSTLSRGKMEGWVRLRMAGQTDWKRLWMALDSSGLPDAPGSPKPDHRPTSPNAPAAPAVPRKKRMSLFGSRDESQGGAGVPSKPVISFFLGPKGRDRKKPFLILSDVTQAFAVYPERPELISRSTLIKVEGTIGDEEVGGGMKGREGWILIMPELESGATQASEMLKWVIGLHDTFHLYGRPRQYTWDPRDPISLMFAYPVGPNRDLLFLEREMAESMDPRDDRTSAVRSRLLNILLERMQGLKNPAEGPQASTSGTSKSGPSTSGPPTLPPLPSMESQPQGERTLADKSLLPQLPPLDFDSSQQPESKRTLSPITESDSKPASRSPSTSTALGPGRKQPTQTAPSPVVEESQDALNVLEGPRHTSPTAFSFDPDARLSPARRPSEDSVRDSRPSSRPASKLSQSITGSTLGPVASTDDSHAIDPANVELPLSPQNRTLSVDSSGPPVPPPLSTTASMPSHSGIPQEPPSPGFSILTSPHSQLGSPRLSGSMMAMADSIERGARTPTTPPISTPKSNPSSLPATPSKLAQPPVVPTKKSVEDANDLYEEAGALYYMQQFQPDAPKQPLAPRRAPPPPLDDDDEDDDDESSSEYGSSPVPVSPPATAPIAPLRTKSPPTKTSRPSGRRSPPGPISPVSVAMANPYSPVAAPENPILSAGMGRRPSGARAPPHPMRVVSASNSVHSPEPHTSTEEATDLRHRQFTSMTADDHDADALAALNFLEQDEQPEPAPSAQAPPPAINEPEGASDDRSHSPAPSDAASQYRSSFAPSRTAMQRKAAAEAQQAAHEAAVHRPGRANGGVKAKAKAKRSGAWGDSSDEEEEEEEEEEEDDDVDSDGGRPPPRMDPSLQSQARQPNAQGRGPSPGLADPNYPQTQARGARTLPQVPGQRSQAFEEEPHAPVPRRFMQDPYGDVGSMQTMQPRPPSGRPQSEYPGAPTAAYAQARQQNMWSQVLDPGHTPGDRPPDNNRDTFIQLEPAAQTMTKAFTPHGLLSAGLQDKQDRSAKKQEELARETGASLINVPNKPPPPQTGLLGAITAHERDRKREGGVGATLTEREREKRLVEERQRKLDDYQRQQLDQMAQGGSMYGMQQYPGYNPMMMGMNPMMTGMNPMMTGGFMGYPGMMPGYNPQHMFAAQQAAAQAYQQAMISFSQAGSQVNGDGGGPAPMNPMMTGAGSMAGFDPRLSMMGMPMMGGMAPQMSWYGWRDGAPDVWYGWRGRAGLWWYVVRCMRMRG